MQMAFDVIDVFGQPTATGRIVGCREAGAKEVFGKRFAIEIEGLDNLISHTRQLKRQVTDWAVLPRIPKIIVATEQRAGTEMAKQDDVGPTIVRGPIQHLFGLVVGISVDSKIADFSD